MSSSPERPAGTPGSTVGYGQGQATGRETAGREYGREYPPAGRHEAGEHRGAVIGFTALAGTLMVLGGLWGILVGIAAVSTNHVYVNTFNSNYVYHWDVNSWGWVEIGLGIVVFAIGVSVFLGMAWARYVGAALAVLSAIANFMFIPFTPIWSIIMIVIDAFIIWALLAPRRAYGEF